MRRPVIRFILAVLATAGMAASTRAQVPEPDQLFERLSPSVWTVWVLDERARPLGTGSAVVVAPGRLITNCHVVDKGKSFSVRRENVRYGATVELSDPDRDLCQLKVANFDAPAVAVADISTLRVGARVFAIGSPKGFEMTLSDGLISALRRDDDGALRFIQTSAPISPGSSGGGLFDQQGRLIGITTAGGRDAQNLNFAVPAQLIAEMPARSQARVAARRESSTASAAPVSMPLDGERRVGDWFEYRVTDGFTGLGKTINLRVDRVSDRRVIFNGGSRVEGPAGEVLDNTAAMLGELDTLSPPGGWASIAQTPGARPLRFKVPVDAGSLEFDLDADVGGEESMRLDDKEYRVVRIAMNGWARRMSPLPYKATVWYAPALNRVLRFTVERRDFAKRLATQETLELVQAGSR